MKNIYELIEVLSKRYFFFILKFPSQTFGRILHVNIKEIKMIVFKKIINQGIQSFDFGVCVNSYDFVTKKKNIYICI